MSLLPSSAASPLSGQSLATGARLRLLGPNAMVPIRAFHSLVEAELARALLESNGLMVQLEDHHTVGAAGHLAQTIGGVKVLVKNEDVELAEDLLKTQRGTALLGGDLGDAPVFRIRSSRGMRGLLTGAGIGLLSVPLLWVIGVAQAAGALVLFFAAAGFFKGARIPRYYCSDRACLPSFDEDASVCPTCKRTFAGTLDHMDQRLEAEEKWRLEKSRRG
jgi:hypothetical protein